MSTLTPFDITGPLPEGTVLLEASAGTGKTWTIGALVARYVADGLPLEDLLVITFGRAASRELRERVREHLRHVHRHVAEPALPSEDEVIAALRTGEPAEVAERARRLRDALTHFDAATIATTHQFCQLVLRGLGVAGDTDPHARLVEDLSDLRDEVVDDLYVRGFAGGSGPPAFTRQRAAQIARAVTENPHAVLDPSALDEQSADARMLGFAHLVRAEMDRRKRRLGVLGYDDLLSHLADALEDEASPARERMRRRWKVVLVDEFQDTDPIQWQVLDRAFSGHSTLVLIGDPKQAIYAFRGGDVDTYLSASATATVRHTLDTNHRSDAPLVRHLSALLGGAELGDPQIVVHPVRAANESSRLGIGPGVTPGDGQLDPVRLRFIPSEQLLAPGESKVSIKTIRPIVAADCAAEITRLLTGGMTFQERGERRALRPSDIAVLAHTRAQLDTVRGALEDVGVRSVIVSSDSIYASDAATDWLTLLEAMELSHRPERVRAAALTPFVGSDARALDERGDDLTDDVARQLRTWAGLLGRRGVAAVLAAASAHGLDARVLAHTGGERRLTDLRHVGEILHQRVVTEGDGLASLTAWLRERMSATRKEERARRLDSDADAVHLATIHASKGLQYPIVLLPFVADRWVADRADVLHFHRPDRTRCLDIGIRSDPGRKQRADQHALEESGESLRLLYVALTRAQSQVITWWFPSAMTTPPSPLHRVLFGRRPGEGAVPHRHPVPGDETVRDRLADWERRGALRAEEVEPAKAEAIARSEAAPDVSIRDFTRRIDDAWRRTSYTALTRPMDEASSGHGARAEDLVTSEPEETAREDDEGSTLVAPAEIGEPVPVEDVADGRLPSPMADLPVGAGFGSLVHAVLEEADARAPDLLNELREHIEEQVIHWPVPDLDRDGLAAALVEVIDTPLGPLAPETTLRDIGAQDRLCEMDFELPLGGGDAGRPTSQEALLGDLATLMREHLPASDPVLPFADVLDDPLLGNQSLRGYLTGSVDIVLRVGHRHLVVDYKTNWLGPADTPLTTEHYDPTALREAMNHSSYPLQAILYGVVLHRFLRWRQPGYDPTVHFGGVLYLYLRGMAGPDTPVIDGQPTGVFSWQPPFDLIEAVSDLLDGRGPRKDGTR